MTTKNILDYWVSPYPPRQSQIEALNWLAGLPDEKRYIMLELPVGTGKSDIAITYSRYLADPGKNGDAYILTPQRILQEQYAKSFGTNPQINLVSFYGKSNYSCDDKGSSCDIGSLIKPTCKNCPYTRIKKAAMLAPNTVMNYALALSLFAYTEVALSRKLIVLDECHNLESFLVDFNSVAIYDGKCKKYNIPFTKQTDIKIARAWLDRVYRPRLQEVIEDLQDQCKEFENSGSNMSRSEMNKLRELNALESHHDGVVGVLSMAEADLYNHFVLVFDDTSFSFKSLYGADAFQDILEPYASEKFLFMSSTILNKEGFCKDLNIPSNNAAFLSLTSEFSVENRPVIYAPACKMNVAWNQPQNSGGLRRMKNMIMDICESHENESGIIHTGNYAIAKWVVSTLHDEGCKHVVYHHNPSGKDGKGDDRNDTINSFCNSTKPSILVSPSITEGLDLKHDLARFALITKIPFGYLGDQWIKKRMELSGEWYSRRALIDIIQGGGRVVRSTDDWGTVYILDESWQYLYSKTLYMIPKWWKDAYTIA